MDTRTRQSTNCFIERWIRGAYAGSPGNTADGIEIDKYYSWVCTHE